MSYGQENSGAGANPLTDGTISRYITTHPMAELELLTSRYIEFVLVLWSQIYSF